MSAPLRLKRQSFSARKLENIELNENQLVAAVLVNTPVSYLEGIYDYLIPAELNTSAIIGTKVIVEFGSKSVEGLIVAVKKFDKKMQKLKIIRSLNSPSGLLSATYINYLEVVRNRFGGSFWNLINQAVPPRVNREESLPLSKPVYKKMNTREKVHSEIFSTSDIDKLKKQIRIKWAINPPSASSQTQMLRSIIRHRIEFGQVLIVVPDEKDIRDLVTSLSQEFSSLIIELGSHLTKSVRYRNFLRVALGDNLVIVSTRSGALAPLKANSTVVVISDLDNSHYEIHSPGWNSRDVALLRSTDTSLIFISPSHSLEIERLIDISWLERKVVVDSSSKQVFSNDGAVSYLTVLKNGLKHGSVLVSVAEKGYSNLFLCSKCRNPANCSCGGKLKIEKNNLGPDCFICAKVYTDWKCSYCKSSTPYVIAKGIEKSAEEIGKALPKSSILISSGTKQIERLPKKEHLVFATSGSEPIGTYSAIVLLDGEKLFNRPFLRSEEIARHHWFNILKSADSNAQVYVSLINKHPLTQSILRGTSFHGVKSSLNERERAKLPPYFRVVRVTGIKAELSKFAENLKNSYDYIVNGPIDLDKISSKLIIRCALADSHSLVDLLDDVVKLQGIKGKNIFQFRFDPFDF